MYLTHGQSYFSQRGRYRASPIRHDVFLFFFLFFLFFFFLFVLLKHRFLPTRDSRQLFPPSRPRRRFDYFRSSLLLYRDSRAMGKKTRVRVAVSRVEISGPKVSQETIWNHPIGAPRIFVRRSTLERDWSAQTNLSGAHSGKLEARLSSLPTRDDSRPKIYLGKFEVAQTENCLL